MTLILETVPAGTTLYIPFTTYAGSTGASVTCSGLAVTDIEIYKNGSATQRASDAGISLLDTDGIDFDGVTGLHGFSINLADNTDSGFYSVGAWYWVVVSAITVDSQTVTFLAAMFRITAAESATGYPPVDVEYVLGAVAESDAAPDVTVVAMDANVITASAIATDAITAIQNGLATATALTAAQGNITSILEDTNEMQLDLVNGGRLDLLLDTLVATTLLTRQIVGNKHTVVESPTGTFTISVRNDADDATVRTIVYIPATGARTVS